ncbi:hypothetical protein HMPREF1870_01833 [Bacteroidales bacterium KA00344]|nr:hypothetical protein HMPREF1870_01833 [Bacteroidales bacterium KA00344]
MKKRLAIHKIKADCTRKIFDYTRKFTHSKLRKTRDYESN